MSSTNGDKSRFNRERKQKAAKRIRNRELLKNRTEHKAAPDSKAKVAE